MPLPPYIIEEIRKREREKKRRDDRPQPQLPIPEPMQAPPRTPKDPADPNGDGEGGRRVIIIDPGVDDGGE